MQVAGDSHALLGAREAALSLGLALRPLRPLGGRGAPLVPLPLAVAPEPRDRPDDRPREDARPQAVPHERRAQEHRDAPGKHPVAQGRPGLVGSTGDRVERDRESDRREPVPEAVKRARGDGDDGEDPDRPRTPADEGQRRQERERDTGCVERVVGRRGAVVVPAAVPHRSERRAERDAREEDVDEHRAGAFGGHKPDGTAPDHPASRPGGGRSSPHGRRAKFRPKGVSEGGWAAVPWPP